MNSGRSTHKHTQTHIIADSRSAQLTQFQFYNRPLMPKNAWPPMIVYIYSVESISIPKITFYYPTTVANKATANSHRRCQPIGIK